MQKLSALNYTGHAINALKLMKYASSRHGNSVDVKTCEWLMEEIQKAVHFVVPLDGRIFDDGLRGIKNAEIHLPFPSITIEYQSSANFVETTEARIVPSSKRFVFAKELDVKGMIDLLHKIGLPWNKFFTDIKPPYHKGVIFVASIYSNDDRKLSHVEWIPCGGAWLLPRVGWDDIGSGKMIEPLQRPALKEKTRSLCGRPVVLLSSIFEMLVTQQGPEMALRHIGNDMGPEAGTVLELIEALTCRNIRIDTLQAIKPTVNARRVRDGKLPLYETKILTVDISPNRPGKPRGPLDEARILPREHLRRGHIQMYHAKDGPVNLWKQSQMVAVGNPGLIKKSYKIKAK